MFRQLSDTEIDDVLSSQPVGRLGCHAQGKTYVIPISYVYDGTCIWAHAEEGMKITMMRANPNVCFQADNMESMANWKSVIVWGEFEEVTDKEQREQGLRKLLDRKLPIATSATVKLTSDWPFHPANYDDVTGIVFRICPREKTGRSETVEHKLLKPFV